MLELELARILCIMILGGEVEERHAYQVGYDVTYIETDCETDMHVFEFGLDKRSSYDSVHQALFAAHVTGKVPVIAIIDTDGQERQFEFQIKATAKAADITYWTYPLDYLVRVQMTEYLRRGKPPAPWPNPDIRDSIVE